MLKLLLFISLIPAQAQGAEMFKILFNLKGTQRLSEVEMSGGVTADAVVVWDERKDGPIPRGAPIGYAERVVRSGIPALVENSELKSAKAVKDQELAAKAAQLTMDKEELAALAAKVKAETATPEEVRRVLKLYLQSSGQ